jgi:hypothetical protein
METKRGEIGFSFFPPARTDGVVYIGYEDGAMNTNIPHDFVLIESDRF